MSLVLSIYSIGARAAAASAAWWMKRKGRWSEESVEQRYGQQLPLAPSARPIWIHAASMGEVRVAAVLAHALATREAVILGTAMTETGYGLMRSSYPKGSVLTRAPFDLRFTVTALIEHSHPRALVLIETELWPNMLTVAAQLQTPIFIVNGRLSDKAFPSYRRTRWFWRPVLSNVTRFYMRSQIDADRMIALGVEPGRVEVSGSLKSALPASTMAHARHTDSATPLDDRPVWIAGSTRPSEEEIILAAHAKLLTRFPNLQLWLVPRHPERFSEVAGIVADSGLSFCPWSERPSKIDDQVPQVVLVDEMGILAELYGHARIAFVGGSLKPFGGHNPMEPALLGVPVIFGPHMDTQRESADMLVGKELAVVVNSEAEIVTQVSRAIETPDHELEKTRRAKMLHSHSSGVVEQIAEDILRRISTAATS